MCSAKEGSSGSAVLLSLWQLATPERCDVLRLLSRWRTRQPCSTSNFEGLQQLSGRSGHRCLTGSALQMPGKLGGRSAVVSCTSHRVGTSDVSRTCGELGVELFPIVASTVDLKLLAQNPWQDLPHSSPDVHDFALSGRFRGCGQVGCRSGCRCARNKHHKCWHVSCRQTSCLEATWQKMFGT